MVKICEHCGKTFKTSRPEKKYCSFECREEAIREQRRKPTVKKICAHCGKEFETTLSHKKYCGKACRDAVHYASKKSLTPIKSVTKPPQIQHSSLDEWIKRAAAAGMSYGKYRAMIEQGRR